MLVVLSVLKAQDINKAGWFSFGMRSTFSAFSDDGTGIGSGGQFRILLSNSVNTDWFGDYISINMNNRVRSEYTHIGWSVGYYPFKNLVFPKLIQPYIVAGHCFDYNKKTDIQNSNISKDRWGSAVQCGVGAHFNLTERFDITVMTQYMIHLTNELKYEITNNIVTIEKEKSSTLEGHLLTTVSINYKMFRLWKK